MTTLAAGLLTLVAGVSSAQTLAQPGILLLAHGGQPDWNARVLDLVAAVDAAHPAEVAFGMAFRPSIQSAVDRLTARGVSEIVAVPLFVSSHSSLVTSTAYLLGLRHQMPSDLKIFATMNHGASAGSHSDHAAQAGRAEDNTRPIVSRVPIRMTPALDRHRIVAEILTTRARAISLAPDRESVVIVAHGPVPDEDNRLWLADMAVLAAGVQAAAPFRSVDFLTVRDDAPPAIRDEAAASLRALVERRAQEGRRVLVVPLLLSFGGIEQGVRKRLAGLDYVMVNQGLMPDERLKQWVLEVATGEGLAPSALAGVGDRVASRESLRSWGSGLRPSWESESASSASSAAPFDSVLRRVAQGGLAVSALSAPSAALVQSASQSVSRQTQEDDYTRYELLAPDTARFRILYEVTATTPGAPFFFNAIRKGSIASDERVIDPTTGQPLKWEVVSGRQARAEGIPRPTWTPSG